VLLLPIKRRKSCVSLSPVAPRNQQHCMCTLELLRSNGWTSLLSLSRNLILFCPVNSRFEFLNWNCLLSGQSKVHKDYAWGPRPTRVSGGISLVSAFWRRANCPTPPSSTDIEEGWWYVSEKQCYPRVTKMNNMNNNEVTNCRFLREEHISSGDWLSLATVTYLDQRGIPRWVFSP